MDWDDPRIPSRIELLRDAYEDWLASTYEARFLAWCHLYHRDPEAVGSAVEFDEWWENPPEE